jgi:2-polyprenyl-3-methyl-5-hydroxy-6-metoxy-1,4-benzoquinol methylase
MSAKESQAPCGINRSWPPEDLEFVDECPLCCSKDRDLAYDSVQDWTFCMAPGKWNYWRCKSCAALYLNPRPTANSIGQCYANYYTHGEIHSSSLQLLKACIKNEYFSYIWGVDLSPRLGLPNFLRCLLLPLKQVIIEPFGLGVLAKLPKGKVLDVGCGNGETLQFAKQMGWDTLGLELDAEAVKSSKKRGLNVLQGGYELLENYPSHFDCIIFSHVLEHVHNPIDALDKIQKALKPGGVLLLSCPNAMSTAGKYFGPYWRGLEAPRHIAIPAAQFLRDYLTRMGFVVEQRITKQFPTIKESVDIKRRVLPVVQKQKDSISEIRNALGVPSPDSVDFIELICTKSMAQELSPT